MTALLKAKNFRPRMMAVLAVYLLAVSAGWKMWETSASSKALRQNGHAMSLPSDSRMLQWHTTVKARGSDAGKGELLSSHDRKNPLRIMRFPVGPKVFATAREILAGNTLLSDHQKIVRFMQFIAWFKYGVSQRGDPEAVIMSRVGTCGEFTNVLLALAATQGIPGRYVNLHNYPPGDGHTVAELFIGGKWRVYDPTYASYYTDTPEEDRTPNVLSFDELRSGKGKNPRVVLIIGNKKRLEETRPLSTSFLGPEIYEKSNPAGPILEDKAFVYPLVLDAKFQPKIDMKHFGPKHQGASHIGAAGICRVQAWTFSSLQAGKLYEFRITPDLVYQERGDARRPFRLVATMLSGGEIIQGAAFTVIHPAQSIEPWKIRFKAVSEKAKMLIHHNLCGPDYAYLKAREFRLREISRVRTA